MEPEFKKLTENEFEEYLNCDSNSFITIMRVKFLPGTVIKNCSIVYFRQLLESYNKSVKIFQCTKCGNTWASQLWAQECCGAFITRIDKYAGQVQDKIRKGIYNIEISEE